ncbi:membrane protein [Actinoplanes ianthinogenes]|uniref:Membrane protein n=1 Tax=Actinoplanes ianthinogenes TaxID=122358 RepID=A0ABM7M3D7_9ACTN|nr:DoxX family membrane protein [Actinoplanes ianthinogenes]BCJ46173.1 membrane protein [Actinoplanes ianthinogenes]GGR26789.1 membrane protein [Actinoplanes ianthinogenes]
MTTIAAHRLEQVEAPGSMLTKSAAKALAVLRVATGFVFLWAFLDKTFGFGYATPSAKAWINGGSPTKGFLAGVEAGPLQGFFHDIAGTTVADWGFMIGLLGIGLAMILGVGLRIAAASGAVMMALMWLAEWPVASGSTNPIVDYHVIYALVGVVLALTYAGHTWGLGRLWTRLPLIQKNRWLI